MIIRLILFAIIAIIIYRFVGGKIPFLDGDKSSKEQDDFTQIEPTSECRECGVYITEDDAIIYQKKTYCSNKCLQEAQKRG